MNKHPYWSASALLILEPENIDQIRQFANCMVPDVVGVGIWGEGGQGLEKWYGVAGT
jgi:hypothetical protein